MIVNHIDSNKIYILWLDFVYVINLIFFIKDLLFKKIDKNLFDHKLWYVEIMKVPCSQYFFKKYIICKILLSEQKNSAG